MRIPQNTAVKNRPASAKAAGARYRRRVERAEMAEWKHVTYTDPATDAARIVNIRHS